MWIHRVLTGVGLGIVGGSLAVVAAQQPSTTADQKSGESSEVVTVTGCVQPETAVLKRNPVAGNIGMGDEYVVTFATLSTDAGAQLPKSDAQTPPPETAATGSAGVGKVYRLTGSQEKDLKAFVGQRLEITGRFKDKEKLKDELGSVGTSGRTVEPTPNNTPEIIIDAFKPAGGACTAAVK